MPYDPHLAKRVGYAACPPKLYAKAGSSTEKG
jgi:hypothetical protein